MQRNRLVKRPGMFSLVGLISYFLVIFIEKYGSYQNEVVLKYGISQPHFA
jgi:hypothetical protein